MTPASPDSDTDTADSDTAGAHRRPRITHLVLVDGLPADHWVEESADVARLVRPRGGPSSQARLPVPLTSEREQRDRERQWLEALVGGRDALLTLDTEPVSRRALAVPDLGPDHGPDLTRRVLAISAECDRVAAEVFGDEELGAALRRLWEAVLRTDPGMLGRSTRDDTAVGALVWVAAQANGLLGPEGRLLSRELWPLLGVPASAAGRGTALLDRLAPGAGQLVAPPGAPRLRPTGRADVLLASTRAVLVARRDELGELGELDGTG